MNQNDIRNAIERGQTALGIEFGSTRIKAVLIGAGHTPLASGSHEWENRYENGVWTYSLDDVWSGLQASYRDLCKQCRRSTRTPLKTVGAIGFSAMMHGYMAFDQEGDLLSPSAPGATPSPARRRRSSPNSSSSTFRSAGALHTSGRRS
jgi:sugar (pentulose or hexulose) kinase